MIATLAPRSLPVKKKLRYRNNQTLPSKAGICDAMKKLKGKVHRYRKMKEAKDNNQRKLMSKTTSHLPALRHSLFCKERSRGMRHPRTEPNLKGVTANAENTFSAKTWHGRKVTPCHGISLVRHMVVSLIECFIDSP